MHAQPILARDESQQHVWQIAWTEEFEMLLQDLPASSSSQQLVTLLRTPGPFQLQVLRPQPIALAEIGTTLRWGNSKVEEELVNLLRRRLIVVVSDASFRWRRTVEESMAALEGIQQDLLKIFQLIQQNAAQRSALQHHDRVYINLLEYYSALSRDASLPLLAKLLQHFAQASAGQYPLFESFKPAPKYGPSRYVLRLADTVTPTMLAGAIRRWTKALQDELQRLSALPRDAVDNVALDILTLAPGYRARRDLHTRLQLLDLIELIAYSTDAMMDRAFQVRLLPIGEEGPLQINLDSLRLQERYEQYKLTMMETYAALKTPRERQAMFDLYFGAHDPLAPPPNREHGERLTPEQRAITELTDGHHLIVAPAGCGKTYALSEYIRRVIEDKNVPPSNIMVSTHLNASVGRIAHELQTTLVEGIDEMLTMTLNKLGTKIFKTHRTLLRRANGAPYFRDAPRIAKDVYQHSQASQKTLHGLARETLVRLHNQAQSIVFSQWPDLLPLPSFPGRYVQNANVEQTCLNKARQLRSYGIFPGCQPKAEEIREALQLESVRNEDQTTFSAAEYYAFYCVLLELQGDKLLYTFEDQITFALAILKLQPEIRREYQYYYEYIIIDEAQDFSRAEADLLLLLSEVHGNLLVFGDPLQDLRRRSASVEHVFDRLRQHDRCGTGHGLTRQFRSTQELLDFTSAVRAQLSAAEHRRDLPSVVAHRGYSGMKPVFVHVQDQARSDGMAVNESTQLLNAALQFIQDQSEPIRGTVALIVTGKTDVDTIAATLRQRDIPFSILDSKSLFQSQHVSNMLVYLNLIADPTSDEHIEQLLRYCLAPYVRKGKIQVLKARARRQSRTLWQLLHQEQELRDAELSEEQIATLRDHLAAIERFSPMSAMEEVEAAIKAIRGGPFHTYSLHYDHYTEEINAAFKHFARRNVASALAYIAEHVAFIEQHRDDQRLFVATVDAAKSQEFDMVMILGAISTDKAPITKRLYIASSRAKDQLLFFGADSRLIELLPKHLYNIEQISLNPVEPHMLDEHDFPF